MVTVFPRGVPVPLLQSFAQHREHLRPDIALSLERSDLIAQDRDLLLSVPELAAQVGLFVVRLRQQGLVVLRAGLEFLAPRPVAGQIFLHGLQAFARGLLEFVEALGKMGDERIRYGLADPGRGRFRGLGQAIDQTRDPPFVTIRQRPFHGALQALRVDSGPYPITVAE